MDAATKEEIEAHLLICAECGSLAADVKKNLVAPFKGAERKEVPSEVWAAIKEKIESEKRQANPVEEFIERLAKVFSFPTFVPVKVSIITLVLIGSWMFHNHQIKQAKEKDQGEYLTYVLAATGSAETEDADLGTPIEKYFL